METEEEIKQYKKTVAESCAGFSIGLWTICLLVYTAASMPFVIYFLGAAGVFSALFGLYLYISPLNRCTRKILRYLKTDTLIAFIRFLSWCMVIASFSVGLLKTDVPWLIYTGLVTMGISLIVLLIGLTIIKRDNRKTQMLEPSNIE